MWYKKIFRLLLILLMPLGCVVLVFTFIKTQVNPVVNAHYYSLPFAKGETHKVVQGYGGLFSHNHLAALDFEMKEGTSIYAARGGVIYAYSDIFTEGGILPEYKSKANYVIIEHNDGTYGCYWHLQHNGVVIKQGNVIQGQLIGYSGSTGYVLNAHLHFSVKRVLNYTKEAYVQTKFVTSNGLEILQQNCNYTKP